MQGLVKLFSLQFFRDPAAPCAQPLPGRQELLTLQLEAPLRYWLLLLAPSLMKLSPLQFFRHHAPIRE